MSQTALVLQFPAQDQRERIRREVSRELANHVGAHRAIHRAAFATHLRKALGLDYVTNETMQRRLRECVDELLDEGKRIVQTRDGYYVPETEEEIAAGRRAISRPAFSYLRKLARYDRVTLAALLELLGQESLTLGGEG